MKTLRLSRDAAKELRQLQKDSPKHAKQIAQKIAHLRETAEPQDSKPLKGDLGAYYRVDAGAYRLIYWVSRDTLYVVLIGKRNDAEIYRKARRRL